MNVARSDNPKVQSLFYDIDELAVLLNSNKTQIQNLLYRYPEQLPPSTKVGNRRLWKITTVKKWIDTLH